MGEPVRGAGPPQAGGAGTGRGRGPGASLLATCAGNVWLVVGSLICASMAMLTGWIPMRGGGTVWFFWARWWSRVLLRLSGVQLRRELRAPIPPGRAYVFLSNHQSLFDIPALLATLPRPARFMAKRELFRIPVFGWALKAGGFIPVDRGAGKGARESFRAATERLARGGSVLIFPEETRSPDGRLLPFKRGGFLLAQRAALPVVPVGIEGTLGVRPRASFRIHPGVVTVRYGEPIPAAGAGRQQGAELLATVRAKIAELARVEAPADDPVAAEPDGKVAD